VAREHQLSFRGREFRRARERPFLRPRAHPAFLVLLGAAALVWLLYAIPFPALDGGRGEWAQEADASCVQLATEIRRQNLAVSSPASATGTATDADLQLIAGTRVANHRRLLARLHRLSTPRGAPEDAVIMVEALTPVYAQAERRARAGDRQGYEQAMQSAIGIMQRAIFELQRAGAPTCAHLI
jgi:hypothetical protein